MYSNSFTLNYKCKTLALYCPINFLSRQHNYCLHAFVNCKHEFI